jgi:cysteine desulfurase
MLSLNGSKIYGPKSSAILFKKEYCNILPVYLGGGQERNIFSGTVDVEKCLGFSIALEEVQKKIKKENDGEKFLENLAIKRNNLLKSILKNIPEAKLIGA